MRAGYPGANVRRRLLRASCGVFVEWSVKSGQSKWGNKAHAPGEYYAEHEALNCGACSLTLFCECIHILQIALARQIDMLITSGLMWGVIW